MRGNKAFVESQRAADAVSNSRAEQILRTSPVARAYYETIMSRVPGRKAAWFPTPGTKSFELGERVKIKMPLMTVVQGSTPSKTGIVVQLDPIMLVRPCRWPKEAPANSGIEFYPNEVERYAVNVRRTLQARRAERLTAFARVAEYVESLPDTEQHVDKLIDTAANGAASDRVRSKRKPGSGTRSRAGDKTKSNAKRPARGSRARPNRAR